MRKNLLTGVSITSPEPDGASAVAFKFNTAVAYVSAGANLFEFSNNGTPKVYASKDGAITAGGLSVDNMSGWQPDSATAVGISLRSGNTYSTDGANLLRLKNNLTVVMDFSFQGGIDHVNSGASTAAHSQSLNLNWSATGTQTSSGQYSTVIGRGNTASGLDTVAIGNGNIVSGNTPNVAIGYINNVSGGTYNAIIGGAYNILSGGNHSIVMGYGAEVNQGSTCFMGITGSGGTDKSHHAGFIGFSGRTTDATPTKLLAGGAAWVLIADHSMAFSALVVARSDESDSNLSMAWRLEGCITRDEANNTALVGSVTKTVIADGAAAAWDISITADDTTEELAITATGEAATNIQWTANVTVADVKYA